MRFFSDKHPTLVFLQLSVLHESDILWGYLIVICSGFYPDYSPMQLQPTGEDVFHFKELLQAFKNRSLLECATRTAPTFSFQFRCVFLILSEIAGI
jgi:hypothetical protein